MVVQFKTKSFRGRSVVVRPGRTRLGWALAFFLALSFSASAMLVTIDFGWGYTSTGPTDLTSFNLQPGSIIQVVAYTSGFGVQPPSPTHAGSNFDQYGYHTGDPLVAEPYDNGSEHYPADPERYLANSTPEGHDIVYQTQIPSTQEENESGGYWYHVFEEFELLDTYDSVYIRVFGATEFLEGESFASYWGISDVFGPDPSHHHWTWVLDDVGAPNKNYFEVIPEPGTLALVGMGGAALCLFRRRRKTPVLSAGGKTGKEDWRPGGTGCIVSGVLKDRI
ncbi:MAG: PEP-CTERM sorting domain-containing protein [Verrucomicrobiota bacterium]|nr:PEP-CTERM sorting domain-containing protein [Verrucomicrobiota bacterium]